MERDRQGEAMRERQGVDSGAVQERETERMTEARLVLTCTV